MVAAASMLTFAYPWLAVLLPLPVLAWRLLPSHAEKRRAVRVPFFTLLVDLSGQQPQPGGVVSRRSLWRGSMLVVCWLLALTALMRPQWIEPPVHHDTPARDLLLLVDLSGSMATQDFTDPAGAKVERLAAVKQVLGDFLSKRQGGDRVGVAVFGDAPFILVPFTADLGLARRLVDEMQVGMAGPRTAFGDAIGLGVKLFARSTVPARTIIALTDGNDTASKVPPADAARVARDHRITIHAVAVGDPAAAGEEKLDEAALRDIASVTGGGFYRALDRGQLADIYRRLDQIEMRKVDTVTFRPRAELFWLPLLVMTVLSMLLQVPWSSFARLPRRRPA